MLSKSKKILSTLRKIVTTLIINLMFRLPIFRRIVSLRVTVTGGFGSQLISYHAALKLQEMGFKVVFEITYFDFRNDTTSQGTKFELDPYIEGEIANCQTNRGILSLRLDDSAQKFRIGISSVIEKRDTIRPVILALNASSDNVDQNKFNIVIHVRRGDFCRVADYLRPIEEQISSLSSVLLASSNLIFLTDDPKTVLPELAGIQKLKTEAVKYSVLGPEESSLYNTLYLMINADILVASNSQLSLICTILSKNLALFDPANYVRDPKYSKTFSTHGRGIYSWRR